MALLPGCQVPYVKAREQFANDSFDIRECAKRVGRVVVTVVKPHQDGTEKRDVWTSNLECVCPVALE